MLIPLYTLGWVYGDNSPVARNAALTARRGVNFQANEPLAIMGKALRPVKKKTQDIGVLCYLQPTY
jgi:hypothetical protein